MTKSNKILKFKDWLQKKRDIEFLKFELKKITPDIFSEKFVDNIFNLSKNISEYKGGN